MFTTLPVKRTARRKDPLVAWYRFEEGLGTTTVDSSPQGKDGTVETGASFTTGKVGTYAMDFDGVSGRVSLPSSTILCGKDAMTFATFIKRDANGDAIIFDKDQNGVRQVYIYEFLGNIRCALYGEGATEADSFFSAAQIGIGTWKHFAVVWDKNAGGQVSAYINGVEVTYGAQATLSQSLRVCRSVGSIGAGTTGSFPFNGQMDDLRIYDRALSTSELVELAAQ